MTFSELALCEAFEFVEANRFNHFNTRARKIGARKYDVESGHVFTVSSVSVEVKKELILKG
jgi:hypothetical protein